MNIDTILREQAIYNNIAAGLGVGYVCYLPFQFKGFLTKYKSYKLGNMNGVSEVPIIARYDEWVSNVKNHLSIVAGLVVVIATVAGYSSDLALRLFVLALVAYSIPVVVSWVARLILGRRVMNLKPNKFDRWLIRKTPHKKVTLAKQVSLLNLLVESLATDKSLHLLENPISKTYGVYKYGLTPTGYGGELLFLIHHGDDEYLYVTSLTGDMEGNDWVTWHVSKSEVTSSLHRLTEFVKTNDQFSTDVQLNFINDLVGGVKLDHLSLEDLNSGGN
jgi:hypothetical protein